MTELLVGLTDLPIAFAALVFGILLWKKSEKSWAKLYFLIFASAVAGAVVHSFKFENTLKNAVWVALYVLLYELIRRFVLLFCSYLKGENKKEKILVFVIEALLYSASIVCENCFNKNGIYFLALFAALLIVRTVVCTAKNKAPKKAVWLISVLILPVLLQFLGKITKYAVVLEHAVLFFALWIAYSIGCESKDNT